MQLTSRHLLPALGIAAALALAGCTSSGPFGSNSNAQRPTTEPPTVPPMTEQTPQATDAPAAGQTTFDSDDDASKAFLAAVAADDHDKVHQILGPDWKDLLTGDKVQDENAFKDFATHAAEHNQLEKKDANTTILDVGKDNWPFPIPIARAADGKWYFDTAAGKQEILARHIGADELGAIDVCHAYVRAQRQYFRATHDDSGVLQYAQRILSQPGTQDGLYYAVTGDEKESPFGPLVADAESEGYAVPESAPPSAEHHAPYHGYHFRVLKSQGAAAPGGAYSYVINGHMVAGYALVAFPDKYGASGIMTFIVSDNGKVYQKDLGSNTTDIARHMTDYDPDSTWTLVQD